MAWHFTYRMAVLLSWLLAITTLLTCAATGARAAGGGKIRIRIVDKQTREPLAARMHFRNARNRPIKVRGDNLLHHGEHFVVDGSTELALRTGTYRFTLDAGPEYKPVYGHMEINNHADDEKTLEVPRHVDLVQEGWWSGDLLCTRPIRLAERLMRAEDLRMAPLALYVNSKSRRKSPLAPRQTTVEVAPDRLANLQAVCVQDERGAVVLHNLSPEVFRQLQGVESTYEAMEIARSSGAHIDVAYAASWDLPLWLAAGQVDTMQVIDSSAQLNGTAALPAGCRRPERSYFRGKTGQGRWSERIYFHVLNSGLRIAPTASSGSGIGPNPPGSGRVYALCGDGFDEASWWSSVKKGRTFVTNGPLLRVTVYHHPPGHVFELQGDQPLELRIGANLAFREKVEYLQVVKNGDAESEVRLDKWAEAGGQMPPVEFDGGGWFVVRAATNNAQVYRYAMTAPFYVGSEEQAYVSRASVEFFIDWLADLRAKDERENRMDDARREMHATASEFWNARLERAAAP